MPFGVQAQHLADTNARDPPYPDPACRDILYESDILQPLSQDTD